MINEKKQKNKDFFYFLIVLIIIDLILGGSGRVVSFGPISLRIFLDFLLLLCFILSGKIKINTSNKILFVLLIYFSLNVIYSILINPLSYVLAEIKGYIPLLLCPIFIWFFNNHDATNSLWKLTKILIRILSLVQLGIWLYALLAGISVYDKLTALFDKFDYGAFAYVDSGNKIPRVFLKTSIFIFIGLIIEFAELFSKKKNKLSNFLFLFIDGIAFITTFTLGFWLSGTICLILFFIFNKRAKKITLKKFIVFLVVLVLGIIVLIRFNIINMIYYRIDSGSVSHKFSQFNRLTDLFLKKPIFGHGFGYETEYYVDGELVNRYMFENVWLQILFHNGLLGFVLFGAYIVHTLINLKKLYNKTIDTRVLILWISLIYICIVSLFNPFINNAIGLTFYAVCVGVSNKAKNNYCKVSNKKVSWDCAKASHVIGQN